MTEQTDPIQEDTPEDEPVVAIKVSMRLPCDAGWFTLWLAEFVRREGEHRGLAGRRPSLRLIIDDDRSHLEIVDRAPGGLDVSGKPFVPSSGLTVRDDPYCYDGYWVLVTVLDIVLAEIDEGLHVAITAFLFGGLGGLAERMMQRAKEELGGELLNVTDDLQVSTRTDDPQVGGRDEPPLSADDPISDEEVEASLEQISDETYREIARLWRKGLTDTMIATTLSLNKQTVKNRVTEMRKLLGERIVPYHRK